MSRVGADEAPPGSPPPTPTPRKLRYFKRKNKPTEDEDKSDSCHNSMDEAKSHNSNHDSQISTNDNLPLSEEGHISSFSNENKGLNIELRNTSIDESITTSISEHIVKHDSIEVSVTNQDTSHPDLSIPSLHLRSTSKSDSEFAGLLQSVGNNSKLSLSFQESDSRVSENSTEKFSDPVDSLENEQKLITPENISNENEELDGNDHISDESSIHTLLDLSSSKSSKEMSNSLSNHTNRGLEKLTSKESNISKEESLNSNVELDEIQTHKNNSKDSSASEEIIKVDIRGTAIRPLPFARSIPQILSKPVESEIDLDNDSLNSNIECNEQMEQVGDMKKSSKVKIVEEYEQDYAIEEMILNETRDIFSSKDNDNVFASSNSSKPNGEGDTSLSTIATEYKTLCEDFNPKIPEFQELILERDESIIKLKSSLTNSILQREKLQAENSYLATEVGKLQQVLSDVTSSNGETKGHLSDFVKHENLINDEDPETLPSTIKKFEKHTLDNFTQTEIVTNAASNESYLNENQQLPIDKSDYVKPVIFLSEFDNFQNELDIEETPLFQKFKEKLAKLMEAELNNKYEMFLADLNYHKEKLTAQENSRKLEQKRLRDLLLSIKSDNPDVVNLRNEMEIKHQKEMEDLRTYFEQKCSDMEKHYSEEVFSQHSKKISTNSSTDSLNNCPEALPFGSPFHRGDKTSKILHKKVKRSRSFEFPLNISQEKSHLEGEIIDVKTKHYSEIQNLNKTHDIYVNELITSHEVFLSDMEKNYKQQIADLKADLQTYQNTEILSRYDHRDADLELEKKDVMLSAQNSFDCNKDTETKVESQHEALLSDPNVDLTTWPLNLIALKDKIEAESQQTIEQLKMTHAQELTALRDKNNKEVALEAQKYAAKEEEWRIKRYEAFDKNRHLEDVVKERDGLKRMILTLQKVLSQLVEYFNLCEDELNNTVIGELLKQIMLADENFDNTIVLNCTIKTTRGSQNPSANDTLEGDELILSDISQMNNSLSKKMHFVPNVNEIMTYIDADCTFDGVDNSQDISVNFKHDLDTCLKRLKNEAHELLALSSRRIPKRLSILENEKEQEAYHKNDCIKDDNDFQTLQELYDKSEAVRKELEESLAQSMYQEVILRGELEMAMDKIAELVNEPIPDQSKEIISEGYGIVIHPRKPVSLPPHPRQAITSPPPLLVSEGNTPEGGRSLSLDGIIDKRTTNNHEVVRRLTCEIEATTKEKEDLQLQLEAANKQLRSTRQFLEEQATEREQERDDYQQQLEQLKDEISKLTMKTQHHTRVCKELSQCTVPHPDKSKSYVEQLETQIREMTGFISDVENQKSVIDSELKASGEKTLLLRDIIGNLETQLEKKSTDEISIQKELLYYKEIAEEKELKMKDLSSELEKLKTDLADRLTADVLLAGERNVSNIAAELEIEKRLVEQMRGQLEVLVETLTEHTSALENLHEAVCSQSCSSPSEDVSIKDQKKKIEDNSSQFAVPSSPSKLTLQLPLLEISRLGDCVHRHLKAEDAALKRIRDLEMQLKQLKDVAQELRTERDILQERMSEQSLRISSLQSRLDQTRHTAEQIRHQTTEDLRLQLDEAHSEIQLLRESLDSRDKQVARLKSLTDKKKTGDDELDLSTGSNKEVVHKLKRELRELQSKNKELQEAIEVNQMNDLCIPEFLKSVVADKDADIDSLKQQLSEKEKHLQAVLCLKLDDEHLKLLSHSEKDVDNQAKLSGRTLSDILSISEFDEPELMRKAEIRPYSFISDNLQLSLNGTKNQNVTSAPDIEKILPLAATSGFHSTQGDRFITRDLSAGFEKNESIPEEIQHYDGTSLLDAYKRNVNETTVFGVSNKSEGHSSANKKSNDCNINENCSMFPNKDASDSRNISVEPKKIDFSQINSSEENHHRQRSKQNDGQNQNKEKIEELLQSFKELGIEIKLQSSNSFEILTQVNHHISMLQKQLEAKEMLLKSTQEQLIEFPALQNEMEELKNVLQNSLRKMDADKLYYSSQLDKLIGGEKTLKQQLQQAIEDTKEKAKELQILKEDIVRRENVVLELTKEKRNLQHALSDLENKYQILDKKHNTVEDKDLENSHLKKKFETLISEKNQQIDNLNVNLDQLDGIQRDLNDKEMELEKLNHIINEKSSEIENLSRVNKNLLSKEQYVQNENSQLMNQVKNLNDDNFNLKNENIKFKESLLKLENDFANISQREIDVIEKEAQQKHMCNENKELTERNLKLEEFQHLLSELDSPRSPNSLDHISPRQEKLDLNKIKNHISKLQNEINFKRKELSGKVFELERAKLEIIDLKAQTEELSDSVTEKNNLLQEISQQRDEFEYNLNKVINQLQEEGNLEELHAKLSRKIEECNELEREVNTLKAVIERNQRDMNSDRERDNRLQELSYENGRLKQQISTLENRLSDQENLISDLNDVKESLVIDLQELEVKSETEKDTSARLKILLDTEKQMANNIQSQDCNVIQILKGRLEVALDSEAELKMSFEREKKSAEQSLKQIESLKKQIEHLQNKTDQTEEFCSTPTANLQERFKSVTAQLEDQVEITELLKAEVIVLKTKRDREKSRLLDLQNVLDREKLWFQKEIDASKEQCSTLKRELAELMRYKHEMHLELVHSREKLHLQKNEILALEKRLSVLQESQKSYPKSESYKALLNDMEQQKNDLIVEISTLKHGLEQASEREKKLHMLLASDGQNAERAYDYESSTLHHLKEMQTLLKRHITENVQMSETVRELTKERKDLQLKVKHLEGQVKMGGLRHTTSMLNLPEGVDQQVRFLYGRFMRMQSYRKALIWQKNYLLKVVNSFEEWQAKLVAPETPIKSRGLERWKCVIIAVRSVIRMRYLVRRWQTGSKLAANIHLNIPNVYPTDLRSSKSYTHIPSSPTSREKPTRSRHSLNNPSTSHQSPSTKHTNKSWSMGSAVNLSQPDRMTDRHLSSQHINFMTHQPPYRSNLMFRDNVATYSDTDRWNTVNDQHWLRASHPDLPEFREDNYNLRSSATENDASSALSRYSNKMETIRHKSLNTNKDVP
ncbi:pericentrin-like protein [Arctopsyche grandis]|uniref:pericentrin-like protein n=1 Tax=Arctopsyche grandis TaxID=121162 RepID=UPI00406D92F2